MRKAFLCMSLMILRCMKTVVFSSFSNGEKTHMACCEKYKPCILKYKALILKYMPYIFGRVKCTEKQNLTKASKMPRKIVAKRARKSALRCALRPSVLHAQKSDCCHVYVEMSEKVARKTINRAVLYNKDMCCSLFIYCVPCKIKAERFCSVGKMGGQPCYNF